MLIKNMEELFNIFHANLMLNKKYVSSLQTQMQHNYYLSDVYPHLYLNFRDNNFIKDFPQLADGLMVIPLPVEEQCRGVLSEPLPNLQLLSGESYIYAGPAPRGGVRGRRPLTQTIPPPHSR